MGKSNLEMPTDEQLWKQFKSGNKEAFARIYRVNVEALYKYGSKFTDNSELVEDAIQDLFLIMWRKRSKLSDINAIKPYLLGSLRKNLLRELKRNKIAGHKNTFYDNQFHLEFSHEDLIISEQLQEETLHNLKKVLEQLTKRQREVLYLKYYNDLSYEEISSIMSLNYQSTRNLVYNALKSLKEHFPTFTLGPLLCMQQLL
ncbi:sigma-70 family RNA polymerase sigma factor [Fulvivirgaceae bacterium BMA10]|uniref:Sigma-70 family RNA polymerase sigma factor n=1 Tax=Splendidivirga corallicola TaxID=3051826 RepID=A0ABT8KH12_9BACT|nr:sigma-70 family RNA polymerase sigma factor [Fulvivirgaceae bacterium BMA10]